MSPIPWFKVDDKLHDHVKARKARKAAMGVWVLAGSWCGDNMRDGFVPEDVLLRWGTRRDAQILVDVGLWHPAKRDGETGWVFHEWETYQPTKAQVEAERARKAEAGRKGGRNSGRSRREASAQAGASGLVEPPSRPDPNPLLVATSSQSSTHPAEVDDDGLTRIQQALNNCPKTHAKKTATFVLAKAPAGVRNPVAYILAAIREDPGAFRYKRGNPKRDQECGTHAGEWVDACRGCAIDRKVGNA